MFPAWMIAVVVLVSGSGEQRGVDQPFVQEVRKFFCLGDGLPTHSYFESPLEHIRSIVVTPEGMGIAGLVDAEEVIQLIEISGDECRLLEQGGEEEDKTRWHRIASLLTKEEIVWKPGASLEDLKLIAGEILPSLIYFVATRDDLWFLGDITNTEKRAQKVIFTPGTPILSVAARSDGAVAVGSEGGLFVRWKEDGEFAPLYPADSKYSWAPRKVAAVAFDSRGRLWFGCDQGVGVFDGKEWKLYTGAEGLPYDHFTCAAAGEDGVIWFGTERGAIRFDGQHWSYRAGERWLPDDRVNGIAVDASGTAWIATPKGISRIERKEMTLEKKATFFIEQVEARHNRDGYVTDCALSRKGDLSSWFPKITDNDGGYTACHGAAMAFRYAVTQDGADKAIAQRCLEACIRLVDIVPESMRGFPARVLIPVDWPEPVNEQYNEEYNKRGQESDPFWKSITPRFVKSEDGKYLWKCDTSSDELAAHYFLYAVYYDLAAGSEEEKEPIRRVVREITDHLIRNGYNLIDHDDRPTRWGRFGPDYLLTHEGWEQRGLNSLMVLSFLATAEHITGDAKYAEAARELRDKYHYHMNTLQPRITFPPEMVAPWDGDLGLWSYYTLMHYEKDPALLMLYRQSLEHFWLFVSKQKNPLWNLLYGACAEHFKRLSEQGYFDQAFPENPIYRKNQLKRLAPYDQMLPDTLDTLRGLPLDLIAWEMKNSHRLDVQLDPTPGQQPAYGWSRVDGKALPIEERGHVRQDRDGFALDYCEGPEGSGFSEHEGTFYLLPYELGRYHGFY